MIIRAETKNDEPRIHAINVAAFERPQEAELVDGLRAQVSDWVSLVAEEDGAIVGHIVFSPVSLANYPELKIIGLAPMAVLPDMQSKGVGAALAVAGLERCEQLGFIAAVVLGSPNYYGRFGFEPASRYGLDSEYDVPGPYFMALEIKPKALQGCEGRISYHSLFDSV